MSFNNPSKFIRLWCVVEGKNILDNTFRVNIDTGAFIDDLKQEIKKSQDPEFNDIAPNRLQIFKDNIPVTDTLATRSHQAQKLPAMDQIRDYWLEQPNQQIQVVVVLPAGTGSTSSGHMPAHALLPYQTPISQQQAPQQGESSQRPSEEDESFPPPQKILSNAKKLRAMHSVFSSVGGHQWNIPPVNYPQGGKSPTFPRVIVQQTIETNISPGARPSKPPAPRMDIMTGAVGADLSFSVFSDVAGDQFGTPQLKVTEDSVQALMDYLSNSDVERSSS